MPKNLKTSKEELDHLLMLEGSDLAMEFMNVSQISYVSPSAGFFAIAEQNTNEILIFGAERGTVRKVSLSDDFLLYPFNAVQSADLGFKAKNGKVKCHIGGGFGEISANSYIEAAMKALILANTEFNHGLKK